MSSSNSQCEYSSKNLTKENSQIIQSSQSPGVNNKKENILMKIRKLYPKISDDLYEENNASKIKSTLMIKNELVFKRHSFLNSSEEEDNNNLLSDSFLQNLVKRSCPLNKSTIISVMSKFIQNTSLIQKIQKEFQSDKKVDINELSIMCAEILNYMELKKGKVLFRIGDIGDRFYFILSGKICILKLKEIKNIQMNFSEYIDYCMFLIKEKETYILHEVIKKNQNIFLINFESEIRAINKIQIMKKLKHRISQQLILNIKTLNKCLEKLGCKPENLDIVMEELEEIENNNNNKNKVRELNNYILEKCKPSFNDLVLFEPYESKIESEEKFPVTCFCYEPFLFLGKGLFFGDFALDSEINKRNATIRAEEDTILGFLKSVDYINIFALKRKIEKLKEIAFLYNTYFFGNINSRVFEKNYFHLFYPREYIRNNVLFIFGSDPKSLILLKEGKVSLELKASIIDLHNLIKFLWDSIRLNKWYKTLNNNLQKEIIPNRVEKKIRKYIEEPIFGILKVYGEKFIQEMNKIKAYQISVLTRKEIIGLEEIYLNIPYLMKGTVNDNKIYCYEISVEHINKCLNDEKQIVYHFCKSSINKIISLIERLQNLKSNGINMAKSKFDKEKKTLMDTSNNNTNNQNYNKVNIANKDKDKEKTLRTNKFRHYHVLKHEENKTLYKNNSYRNIYNNSIVSQKFNNVKTAMQNKLENIKYKSPVKQISTNLNPVLKIITSRQQKKINNKETKMHNYNKYIILQSNPNDDDENNNSKKVDGETNINDNNTINNDNDNENNNTIECNNKYNLNNSYSTDAVPFSSDVNLFSQNNNIINSKTINELKKQLENINVIEFENNEILNLKKSNNMSIRSFSYNCIFKNEKIVKMKKNSILRHQSKINNFHLSYVPLNVLSTKGKYLQRSHSTLIKNKEKDKDNSLLSSSNNNQNKKKLLKFYNIYSKRNRKELDEEKDIDKNKKGEIYNFLYGKKTNGIQNISNVNINKALSRYICKQDITNEKNKEDIKKRVSPDVIKSFYNKLKKRGYSSFIPNKQNNTIFTRKYRRKYGSENSSINTYKYDIESNKYPSALPIINEKYNDLLKDKGIY